MDDLWLPCDFPRTAGQHPAHDVPSSSTAGSGLRVPRRDARGGDRPRGRRWRVRKDRGRHQPRGHGEAMTVQSSSEPRRHRVGRREADHTIRGGCHRRKDRTDRRSGTCRRTGDREVDRAGDRGAHLRVERRGARHTGGPLGEVRDHAEGSREGRARTRPTGARPGELPLGAATREVGAHSRGARPPATPRWARKGARGVRVSAPIRSVRHGMMGAERRGAQHDHGDRRHA